MKIKFHNQLIIALLLGIFVGLMIGEYASAFQLVGDAFIGLLQMTVMPYIMVTLIVNLGKIELKKSGKLISFAALLLVVFMVIGILMVLFMPAFFPRLESSSFFSFNMIREPEQFDFLGTYIPSNIFYSLSASIVPAVVLFSILLGIALNGIDNKSTIINGLEVIEKALNRANKIIIKLTPYGIFGIAAHTAGTISFSQLGLLQVYLITYTIMVLIFVFIFLPLLISALTPFTYTEILKVPRATLIAIFATSKIIILLPQMIEDVQKLFNKHTDKEDEVKTSSELLLPLLYPFPNLGTIMIMVFVPFGVWFIGRVFDFNDYVLFSGATLMSSFVSPVIGIPYLLDLFRLPHDLFQLFILSSIWTDRIRVVLGAMSLYTITIISMSFYLGILKINVRKITLTLIASLIILLALSLPLKFAAGDSFQKAYNKYGSFISMNYNFKIAPKVNEDLIYEIPDDIQTIRDRGFVRVGYFKDALPYVFNNVDGLKVGFDAELANRLARDLNVGLQWINVPREDSIAIYLNQGRVDLVMCGIPILVERIGEINYSEAYSSLSAALVVRDHKRYTFKKLQRIQTTEGLTIAIPESDYLYRNFSEILDLATLKTINSPRTFFRDTTNQYDALLYSAEAGSAWTLVYPEYSVIVPQGLQVSLPVVAVMAINNEGLTTFMNEWIKLKKMDGTIEKAYNYWILGKGTEETEERWSILKDELHWID